MPATGLKKFAVKSSWGAASLRQCAGFPAYLLKNTSLHVKNEPCYICPLGSEIVCWEIANHEKKISFQAHNDIITVMLHITSLGLIVTGSFSGELKFWDEDFVQKLSLKTDSEELHFASLSENGDKLVLIYYKNGDSYLAFYDIGLHCVNHKLIVQLKWKIHVKSDSKNTSQSVDKGEESECIASCQSESNSMQESFGTKTLEAHSVHSFELELPNMQPVAESNDGMPMLAKKQPCSSTFVKIGDGYVITLFTSEDNIVALFQRHGQFSEAHMYNACGKFVKSQPLDPLGDKNSSILCTSPCHNRVFAVGFQGGLFLILSEANLSVTSLLQATGSPQVALWDGDFLIAFSYLSGHVSWWTTGGELVSEIQGGPKGSIIHLDWAVPGKELWVGGIMSLHYVTLEKEDNTRKFPTKLTQKYQLQFHKVTGCGVAFTGDSNHVISGDFTGKLCMWKTGHTEAVAQTQCLDAVRCIVWKNGAAYCGCLDGTLSRWIPYEPLVQILACAGSVLNMAWAKHSSQLAIGLDSGHLTLYQFGSEPVELLNIAAHHLIRDGIEHPAEIWSLCWSPCETMIATASEDQTASIWSIADGK